MAQAATKTPSKMQAWVLAARPKTLPAAVAPVLVGTALAVSNDVFVALPALAALVDAILIQIAVNFANDYFDFKSGVDTEERLGPVRATASGLITPGEMKRGIIIVMSVATLIGLYLVIVGGWPILAIGIASLLATLAYSAGPLPLASNGLGDIFVFIFFGLIAVGGTYYVQALEITLWVIAAGVSPGLLITAIIVVNNLRDIDTDRKSGKRTLAVMLGRTGSRIEYITLIAGAYVMLFLMYFVGGYGLGVFLPVLSIPLAIPLVHAIYGANDGPSMNKTLAGTARLSLVFCVLMAVGLLLPL